MYWNLQEMKLSRRVSAQLPRRKIAIQLGLGFGVGIGLDLGFSTRVIVLKLSKYVKLTSTYLMIFSVYWKCKSFILNKSFPQLHSFGCDDTFKRWNFPNYGSILLTTIKPKRYWCLKKIFGSLKELLLRISTSSYFWKSKFFRATHL